MKTAREILSNLDNFYGSECTYKYGNSRYTEGIKYLAEHCHCYWLLDIVNSIQCLSKVRKEYFQCYTLKITKNHRAILTVTDGNNKKLYTQGIPYTDFPLDEITFWRVYRTIMLRTEY